MAENFILGSGVTGMLAKHILGWKLVPFYRSRFFSFKPALDDNYIIHDSRLDDFMTHLGAKPAFLYKVSYSLDGQLLPHADSICNIWAMKVFGSEPPQHLNAYMGSHTGYFIYNLKLNELYEKLQSQYKAELSQAAESIITEIGDHYFIRGGKRVEFDRVVSTIPLKVLLQLCRIPANLTMRRAWFFHIKTNGLDFEGANQVLVADQQYDFYKVTNIAPERYLFCCLHDIPLPGPYFQLFMPQFDIIDGTTIDNVIPIGTPSLSAVERLGITCIGAHAEHDWCADVGSNLLKLLRTQGANPQPRIIMPRAVQPITIPEPTTTPRPSNISGSVKVNLPWVKRPTA